MSQSDKALAAYYESRSDENMDDHERTGNPHSLYAAQDYMMLARRALGKKNVCESTNGKFSQLTDKKETR